jgi:hypothetical protein
VASANPDTTFSDTSLDEVAPPVLITSFAFALGGAVLAGAAHPAAGMAILVGGLLSLGMIDGIFRKAMDRRPVRPPAQKLLAAPTPVMDLAPPAESDPIGASAPRKTPTRRAKPSEQSDPV